MHLSVIPREVNTAAGIAVFLVASWKGGWRERVVGTAIAAEVLFSSYLCGFTTCWVARTLGFQVGPSPWRPSVDDGIVLAICVVCAVRADRYWSIFACSVALLGEVCDLAIFIPGISQWAVMSASLVFTYALEGMVLWGVWSYQRALRDAAGRDLAAGAPPAAAGTAARHGSQGKAKAPPARLPWRRTPRRTRANRRPPERAAGSD